MQQYLFSPVHGGTTCEKVYAFEKEFTKLCNVFALTDLLFSLLSGYISITGSLLELLLEVVNLELVYQARTLVSDNFQIRSYITNLAGLFVIRILEF